MSPTLFPKPVVDSGMGLCMMLCGEDYMEHGPIPGPILQVCMKIMYDAVSLFNSSKFLFAYGRTRDKTIYHCCSESWVIWCSLM